MILLKLIDENFDSISFLLLTVVNSLFNLTLLSDYILTVLVKSYRRKFRNSRMSFYIYINK